MVLAMPPGATSVSVFTRFGARMAIHPGHRAAHRVTCQMKALDPAAKSARQNGSGHRPAAATAIEFQRSAMPARSTAMTRTGSSGNPP